MPQYVAFTNINPDGAQEDGYLDTLSAGKPSLALCHFSLLDSEPSHMDDPLVDD
jgi:hypothetical protein